MNGVDLNAVEIWFPVERDADNYPRSQDWEQLWAWPAGGGFRIDNVPFFAKGIARGDIIAATPSDKGWLRFENVIQRSGHSTFRIWITESYSRSIESILEHLRDLGCTAEVTLERLIAIDVSEENEERVWRYLQSGLDRNDWDLQVGHSPG